MQYCVASHNHQKTAAEGEGVLVTFDYKSNHKVDMPQALRRQIEKVENGEI